MKDSSQHIVAIIQARLQSKRLARKVLQDISGKPMLEWVVDRARLSKWIDEVVVATTTETDDDAVVDLCHRRGYPVVRGSMNDVLDRYYQAARKYHADIVVRLTADCPLIDPGLIDHTINEFIANDVDFAANRLPPPFERTYPIGLDTEVCTFMALETAWQYAKATHEREHVMPYLYEEPGRFKVLRVDNYVDYGHLRWTVDTIEDLQFVRRIFSNFEGKEGFTWLDVLDLVRQQPQLAEINQNVKHKTYLDVDDQAGNP